VELAPCWFGAAKTDLSLLFFPNGNPQFGRDTTSQQGLEEKIHCSVITACQLTQANVLNASTGNFPE
jgi:hypothetical protein